MLGTSHKNCIMCSSNINFTFCNSVEAMTITSPISIERTNETTTANRDKFEPGSDITPILKPNDFAPIAKSYSSKFNNDLVLPTTTSSEYTQLNYKSTTSRRPVISGDSILP